MCDVCLHLNKSWLTENGMTMVEINPGNVFSFSGDADRSKIYLHLLLICVSGPRDSLEGYARNRVTLKAVKFKNNLL